MRGMMRESMAIRLMSGLFSLDGAGITAPWEVYREEEEAHPQSAARQTQAIPARRRRIGSAEIGAQLFASGGMAEPPDRLFLDLPDPFTRELELLADLFEGEGVFAAQPEIEA